MPSWRWTFYDPIDEVTITLPVNPKEGGTPPRKKNFVRRGTTAPEGRTILFQGLDDPKSWKVSGTLFTQEHLELLDEWYEKNHQIRVTDDLGRSIWIVIEEFTADRRWSYNHPWRHDYTLTAVVLDIPA